MTPVKDVLVSIYLLVPSCFWEVILPAILSRWMT